jgi:hypothetical protein
VRWEDEGEDDDTVFIDEVRRRRRNERQTVIELTLNDFVSESRKRKSFP